MSINRILIDPQFNPQSQVDINSSTKLASGITMAKFLGSYGDRTSFNHESFAFVRRQIARNLVLHAMAIKTITENPIHFNDVRLIVSEGVLDTTEPTYRPADDISTQKSKGELIYYQVIGQDGRIDFEKTFEVAEYWKDFIEYEKIILDYDEYNKDESLTAQIGLLMPSIPLDFKVEFKKEIETQFNNNLQSFGELVEILPKD
ncbi:MAG: hypothetical protein CMO97_06175 [Woeseia sp.]|nr:hypothetical protein [Woeseia sp.]|tara:strand:- start:374 stop:982 length:609 start_codon:yes stop_codon:yes gene_type:complete